MLADPPANPATPEARALELYERSIAAADAAPWRATPAQLAEAERYHAALEGREPAAWTLEPDERRTRAFLDNATPDELARLEADAYAWASAVAYDEAVGPSLDTWEHLHTSNSATAPAPARALSSPGPLGQGGADRVKRYDSAKAQLGPAIRAAAGALAAADPEAPGPAMLDRMADHVATCRDVRALRDAGCGAVWARPFSCDVRLCPDCERARSAAYLRRVESIAATMARPVSIVLTIPNVPAGFLGLGVDMILDSWARMRRTAIFAGGPCRNAHQDPDERRRSELPPARARCKHAPHREPASRPCATCRKRSSAHVGERTRGRANACPAFLPAACSCPRCVPCRRCVHPETPGGIAALEVTYNAERNNWHPHMHLVIDLPEYLPHSELRDAWRAATCDATRAGVERAPDHGGRGAGYRRPERRPRLELRRCKHLADRMGRPADMRCAAGHGWRVADADRCPHQSRDMAAPCGARGEAIPEPERCRGASVVWIEAAKDHDGKAGGVAAVREAVKYATKGLIGKDGAIAPAVLEAPELLAELLLTLRNRRLVNGWGMFHGITDDPDDADAPELVELEVGELFPIRVPKLCPSCGIEALWDYLGTRRRRDCAPGPGGRLYWFPPAGGSSA